MEWFEFVGFEDTRISYLCRLVALENVFCMSLV